MRRTSNLPCLLSCLLAAWLGAWSGRADAQAGEVSAPADLFASDEPLSLKLEAPFTAVRRKGVEPEYEAARLTYTAPSGETIVSDLRVRARGKSRRELCTFPPLLLNFRARAVAGTVFEGQNRLKLITHCEAAAANAQYVFLEYLAYRAQSLVTGLSLRVRRADVTYVDMERGRTIAVGPGILLEDEEQFAARLGLQKTDDQSLARARYDEESLLLLETFEYFIGNTDWSAFAGPPGTECCHNVVPLARDDGKLVPIGYDFDSSGLVDASYALPNERLPIRDVRVRLYRGACADPAALAATFAPFQARRTEIRALFERYPLLTERSREGALEYIDDFYAAISDPERVERIFRSNCRR